MLISGTFAVAARLFSCKVLSKARANNIFVFKISWIGVEDWQRQAQAAKVFRRLARWERQSVGGLPLF
jgi:hypothetical protein